MAPSDATEKNRNIDAQLQSILYTIAQKRFRKIYLLYDFWCAQTCSFRAVFRLDALAKALSVIATATWLAGWLGVRHTPVLYQNG